MEERQELIRQRAYELWEHEGKPEGREIDCWLKAEREIQEHENSGMRRPGESGSARSS